MLRNKQIQTTVNVLFYQAVRKVAKIKVLS